MDLLQSGCPDRYVTRSRIVRDLGALGVSPGDLLMLHASVRAVGWVVGGPDVVLDALIEALGPDGTLMMVVSWEDNPYPLATWPEERRIAYEAECPAFDPDRSRADRNLGILTEYLRTRPGACRSGHPDGSFAAVGQLAGWITRDHPLQYGYGPGSPLAKLCEAGGKALMLGAPLDTITLLHYSEHMADIPSKRIARYRMPVLRDGARVWVDIEEYDTEHGIADWPGGDFFAAIGREYLEAGHGRSGLVGAASSHLFDAAGLAAFGKDWMERHLR